MSYAFSEHKNLDLLIDVIKARKALGKTKPSTEISHPLVGKQLIEKATGRIYNIEKAHRHWYWGEYLALLIECNQSHTLIAWEAFSCDDPFITENISKAHLRFKLGY